MKSKAIIILLLLSYITVTSFAQQYKTEVTYVGNAGFLIKVGDKKILIDALFKGYPGSYELPADIQSKLLSAMPPFDDVDLIIVTHAHGDHVDVSMVTTYMKHNPQTVFVSTKQLVDHMNDSTGRSIGFNPTKGQPEKRIINGINIEAFLLPHGPDSRIINNGFLISVDGTTLLHTGDVDFDQFTFEEFRLHQFPEKEIDLSFIQHFYLTSDSVYRKFVTVGIGGKYIIPIHYHFTTPPFDSLIIKQNYPEAILFNDEMQSWHMPQEEILYSDINWAYLGQTPPDTIPIVFAPGIISTDSTIEHGSPAFSPDGNEVFWQSNKRHKDKETEIYGMYMKCVDGHWTEPETSPFGEMPVFSLDGQRLYFLPSKENRKERRGPYYVEKYNNSWSYLGCMDFISQFPEIKYTYSLSFAADGTMYFFGHAEGLETMNNFGIYRSELVNGNYSKPELLPQSINATDGVLNWTPTIAHDESYLLFSSNRHNSQQDIYICFKLADNSWSEAYPFGEEINTSRGERFPKLSPDGRYLFFTRWVEPGNEDIMWVSSKVIDNLRKRLIKK